MTTRVGKTLRNHFDSGVGIGRYLIKVTTITSGNNAPENSNEKYLTGRLQSTGEPIAPTVTDIFGTYTGVTPTVSASGLELDFAQPDTVSDLVVVVDVISSNKSYIEDTTP